MNYNDSNPPCDFSNWMFISLNRSLNSIICTSDDDALEEVGFSFNLWLDPDVVFVPQFLSSFSKSKGDESMKA